MSFPTVLAPWFIVQKAARMPEYGDPAIPVQYYAVGEQGEEVWTEDPNKAYLFMSIHSAHRVARAAAGEVRALCDQDDLKEFRPKGEL